VRNDHFPHFSLLLLFCPELFDVSDNLFQGKFPIPLLESTTLEVIDLSRNNFEDNIPTGIGNLKKLKELRLNENMFHGSIPFEIFNAAGIKELMLQSNELTGGIPTEIANLESVEGIFMSHNNLKGPIPIQLGAMKDLQKVHLHRNQLHGVAPILMRPSKVMGDSDYVTDCGFPEWDLTEPLLCEGCTMCCNSEENCQLTHPHTFKTMHLILTVILTPLLSTLLFLFFLKKKGNCIVNLFVDARDPLTVYNDDSVYCFILSSNKIGTILYALTVAIQVTIFSSYLRNSEFSEHSDWEYSFKCLGNDIECERNRSDNEIGILLFFTLTILFLGNDITMSFLQMRKAIYLRDMQLFLSGFILFFLTSFALLVSFRYNTALAEKNSSWITNAIICYL